MRLLLLPLLALLSSASASPVPTPDAAPAPPFPDNPGSISPSDSLEKRTLPKASTYGSLVAFGASYTDNAHARSSAYASSLRNYYPYSNYGGRYTNGPVAVEYMVASGTSPALAGGKAKLIDYAYGGSHIDNFLTGGSSPASKDQVAQYLKDVASGAAAVSTGKVLHYINSGINPMGVIWTNAINAGSTTSAINTAKAAVTANVNALAAQMRSINTNSGVAAKIHGADFLIVGIPPLEIVPTYSYQVNGDAKKLALLKSLSAQFNSELKAFATHFAKEQKNGKAWFYDLAALWYNMNSSPTSYGITVKPTTSTCYNSSTGGVCTNPGAYLYFDTLHPVTSVHKVMATKMNILVKNGQ